MGGGESDSVGSEPVLDDIPQWGIAHGFGSEFLEAGPESTEGFGMSPDSAEGGHGGFIPWHMAGPRNDNHKTGEGHEHSSLDHLGSNVVNDLGGFPLASFLVAMVIGVLITASFSFFTPKMKWFKDRDPRTRILCGAIASAVACMALIETLGATEYWLALGGFCGGVVFIPLSDYLEDKKKKKKDAVTMTGMIRLVDILSSSQRDGLDIKVGDEEEKGAG